MGNRKCLNRCYVQGITRVRRNYGYFNNALEKSAEFSPKGKTSAPCPYILQLESLIKFYCINTTKRT